MLSVGVTVSSIHHLLSDLLKKGSKAVQGTAIRGCVGRIEIKLRGCGKQLLNMSKSLSITLTEDVYQPVVSNTVGFWLHSQLLLGDQITASVQNNLSLPSLEYEVLTVCIRGCCGLCFCRLRMELSQIEPQYHLCMFRNKS